MLPSASIGGIGCDFLNALIGASLARIAHQSLRQTDRKKVNVMAPDAWNPATELARLDHEFVDLIDHFMRHDWGEARPNAPVNHLPPVESFVDGGRLVIRIDLPGVDPSEVAVKVNDELLTIKGSRASASECEDRHFVHREIRCGNLERVISIPKGVTEKDLSMSWRNGVLEIIIPIPKSTDIKKVPQQISGREGGSEGCQ